MQVSVQQIDPVTVQLTIETDSETVQRAFDKAARFLGRNVRVPGFRPGQVPLSMLKQRLTPDTVRRLASEILIEENLERALKDHELVPFRTPRVEIEKFQEGEPFRFKATVPLKPVVEKLGDYTAIEVALPTVTVGDEEVLQVVENLRQEAMRIEPVANGKAEAEDRLIIQLRPLEPEDAQPKRFLVILGRTFAELDNALVGMQENETKQLELTFPESWDDEHLASKTVAVELTLQKIHRPIYPTDEELAELFQHESIESLKETTRRYILERKLQDAIDQATDQLLQALRERSAVHIPQALIDEEARDEAQRFMQQLVQNNLSLEQFLQHSGMTREQLNESIRQRALVRLQNTFLLLAIADQEQLQPAPEEVTQYIEDLIERSATTPQERARMRADEQLHYRAIQELRIEKALQKLTAKLQNKDTEGATP